MHIKDRDYYRALSTNELIAETTYGIGVDYKELSIALAERLRTQCDETAAARYDYDCARREWD